MTEGKWSICSLCNQVVSENSLAVCPANNGGKHQNQKVKFSISTTSSQSKDTSYDILQPGWNKCGKCFGIYYSSLPGVCHDGKAHVKLGSDYWLPVSTSLKSSTSGKYTTGFKMCTNCTVLCNGSPSGCASSSGNHMYTDAGYYSLMRSEEIPHDDVKGVTGTGPIGMTLTNLINMSTKLNGMTYVGPYIPLPPSGGMTYPLNNSPSDTNNSNSKSGASSTTLALAIGIPVGVIVLVGIVWWYRRNRNRVSDYSENDNVDPVVPE